MAIVLASRVTLYEGFTPFVGKPAALELHDDDRLVLVKLDRRTGAIIAKKIDIPLSDVSVRGESSTLSIAARGVVTKVDFSTSRGVAFLVGGGFGVAIAEAVGKNSGIDGWLAALRERGVPVRVRKSALPVLLGILVGLFVLMAVFAAIYQATLG
jgi:hypothetical protein